MVKKPGIDSEMEKQINQTKQRTQKLNDTLLDNWCMAELVLQINGKRMKFQKTCVATVEYSFGK